METFTLKNNLLALDFQTGNGALVGMTALKTGWKILERPELGLNFRLLVPLSEEKRNNPVFGEKQALSRLEVDSDGRSALMVWDGVTSEYGGAHDIRLTLRVTLDEAQAVFAMTVENHSRLSWSKTSTALTWATSSTRKMRPGSRLFFTSMPLPVEWRLWPQYDNLRGYYGVDYPTQFAGWVRRRPGRPCRPSS